MQYSIMLDIVGETRDTEEIVLLYAHVYIVSCMFLKESRYPKVKGCWGENFHVRSVTQGKQGSTKTGVL